MTRWAAAASCDVRLQARNGFYHAAAFVAFCYIVALRQLGGLGLGWLMPPLVLSNLSINTFYFMAALVLLEKREGTLSALAVTPLRPWEYLTSKIATLATLSILENVAIVAIGFGFNFNLAALVLGISMAAGLLTLSGFALVSRYDSINEFLLPSAVVSLAFVPPFLNYFGVWKGPLLYLHPLQAPLLLLRAAFEPIALWQWLYALTYGGFWVVISLQWCQSALRRFVTTAEGVD